MWEVLFPWSEVQFDTDVNAYFHRQEVCEGNLRTHCVGPALRQVGDLERKFAGATWLCECVCEGA